MNLLTFYLLSIGSIVAFTSYHFFNVDFLTALTFIGIAYISKILFYWGLIFYDIEKAREFEVLIKKPMLFEGELN